MTNDFIGSDIAAFNEYSFFLTYHFSLEHDFGNRFAKIGRPLPQSFPEVHVALSDRQFTPDGSGSVRQVTLYPQASAEAGILSWKLFIRDAKGEFIVIDQAGRGGETLVFPRAEMVASTEEILSDNGVRALGSADVLATWEAGKSTAQPSAKPEAKPEVDPATTAKAAKK